MSQEILRRHHEVWQRKPVLRELYTQWYKDIRAQLRAGRTLELGGGSGNLKEFAPDVICTDLVPLPWLDAVADAQRLPFADTSLANIVLFDVLHHLENPRLFFAEAIRVLQPSGRIVIMDPYVSWLSWPVYRFLHPEPVDLSQDPLAVCPPDPARKPFDSNQAVATILFERSAAQFQQTFPTLKEVVHRRLAFFAYPLSGGFEKPSLVPSLLLNPVLKLEHALGFLSRFLAFRILVVLERQ